VPPPSPSLAGYGAVVWASTPYDVIMLSTHRSAPPRRRHSSFRCGRGPVYRQDLVAFLGTPIETAPSHVYNTTKVSFYPCSSFARGDGGGGGGSVSASGGGCGCAFWE
jgi:hypothetical protein